MIAGTEQIVILRAGSAADPYSGENAPSWDTPTRITVRQVLIEPRPSSEPVQDARNAVTSGYTLYLPADVQISAQDRVQVRGGTYSVLGDPAEWRFGEWRPGKVVQVGRTEG